VQAISRPTKRNQSSLWHVIATTDSQLSGDSDWIHLGHDLAAVAHDQEYGWFQNFFEDLMNKISKRATTVSIIIGDSLLAKPLLVITISSDEGWQADTEHPGNLPQS